MLFFFPTRIPGEYLFRPMKQVSTQKTDNEFFCSGHLAMMAMQTVRMIVILLVVVAFLNGMWVGEIIKFWFCDGPSNRSIPNSLPQTLNAPYIMMYFLLKTIKALSIDIQFILQDITLSVSN